LAVNSGSTGAPALLGSAGAFTTLSATGNITRSGSNPYLILDRATTGDYSGIKLFTAGASTGGWEIYGSNAATQSLSIYSYAAASAIGTFSTTGLAVTGALSSTTGATFATSSGNVGIGETSPASFGKLAVYGGAANTAISIKTDSFDGTYYSALNFSTGGQGANDPQAQIKAVGANNYSANIVFSTQTAGTTNPLAERMRIDSSGNVGIGTTPTTDRLELLTGSSNYALKITASSSNFALVRFLNNAGSNQDATIGTSGTNQLSFYTNGFNERMRLTDTGLAVTGALSCTGALSKGSGSFRIEHPLPEKSATHQLVHSFIEGPQADLIYRGKIVLVDGKA
jgi:hypothetical protein